MVRKMKIRIVASILFLVFVGGAHAQDWRDLLDQASSLSMARNNDSAIVLSELAIRAAEEELGYEDTTVARLLCNLGVLCFHVTDFGRALPVWQRSLAIREKVLGPKHLDIAFSLSGTALTYYYLSRFEDAERLQKRALAMREELAGPDDELVANSLSNLAIIYHDQGRYAKAEPLHLRSLAIRQKVFGADHLSVTGSMNNLARHYLDQGRFTEAESLYVRSLAIRERALGADHHSVAYILSDIAALYQLQGRYAEAELLHTRALAINEESSGPQSLRVAVCLSDLASLYKAQGRYSDAEPLYNRALSIVERSLGAGHPFYAVQLSNMAEVYQNTDRYAASESLCKQALAIWEASLGSEHYYVAQGLEALSRLCRMQENYDQALAYANRAYTVRQKNFIDNSSVLSEQDALIYARILRNSADNYLSAYLEADRAGYQPDLNAANVVISSKGQVTDGILERNRLLSSQVDSATRALVSSLTATRHQLSRLFVNGQSDVRSDLSITADSLRKVANDLESKLARRSVSFKDHRDFVNTSVEEIRSLLPDGITLIEYLRFNYRPPDSNADDAIPYYVAVVLRRQTNPAMVILGEASQIDMLVSAYSEHMKGLSSQRHMPLASDRETYEAIATKLYVALIAPVENQLAHGETVLIAPDGAINLVSYSGLIDDDGAYLIEKHAVHYISSAREIARRVGQHATGSGLLAVGDPDFYADAIARTGQNEQVVFASVSKDQSETQNLRTGCEYFSGITLHRLPGTRREIELVTAQWETTFAESSCTFLGQAASEDNLKLSATGKRVIHLATHGYFLTHECDESGPGRILDMTYRQPIENPLLQSGLFFAGANLHGAGADSLGVDDGILTAFEVSCMDLH